jgi:prepilin-type N-terminal cleavage/methylation domain-containing protein
MTERSSGAGFSLVEVLAVLLLIALVMTFVVGQISVPPAEPQSTTAGIIDSARIVAMRSGAPQPVDLNGYASRPGKRLVAFPDGALSHLTSDPDRSAIALVDVSRRTFHEMEVK